MNSMDTGMYTISLHLHGALGILGLSVRTCNS